MDGIRGRSTGIIDQRKSAKKALLEERSTGWLHKQTQPLFVEIQTTT
jgi:hypothetical protein